MTDTHPSAHDVRLTETTIGLDAALSLTNLRAHSSTRIEVWSFSCDATILLWRRFDLDNLMQRCHSAEKISGKLQYYRESTSSVTTYMI